MLKERAESTVGLQSALRAAQRSLREGGIPIGAALIDARDRIVATGHNQRIQEDSAVLHAEIDCLANAGRRRDYEHLTLYSTLMPCYMCAGAVVQFGIPRVVVGESDNFPGAGDFLREHGIEVVDLHDSRCREMLAHFIQSHPDVWQEDIGTHISV